jgi:hypothetical protein
MTDGQWELYYIVVPMCVVIYIMTTIAGYCATDAVLRWLRRR